MQATIKTAQGVRGGAPEKVPNTGDEAYYLPSTYSIYVRTGASWFSFWALDKKKEIIDLARKIAGGM